MTAPPQSARCTSTPHWPSGATPDSTRWIFGDSIGDPTADDIWVLAKERAHGISRTEVRDLFSRNKRAREIDRALTALVDAGRLERTRGHDRTTGRPAEIWIPVIQTT